MKVFKNSLVRSFLSIRIRLIREILASWIRIYRSKYQSKNVLFKNKNKKKKTPEMESPDCHLKRGPIFKVEPLQVKFLNKAKKIPVVLPSFPIKI